MIRKWEHKKKKAIVRAVPWWEIPEPLFNEKDLASMLGTTQPAKMGILVQVGWLLENEHGVWLGVGPKAAQCFSDLGEWVPTKKPRKKKRA